jgi:hypothetical protein
LKDVQYYRETEGNAEIGGDYDGRRTHHSDWKKETQFVKEEGHRIGYFLHVLRD